MLERVAAPLPAGRLVEPGEIAALVSFLASDDAAQITGDEIAVDGGAGLDTTSLGSEGRD